MANAKSVIANKTQIVDAVRKETGMSLKDSKVATESVINTIGKLLSEGQSVRIYQFGTFQLADRAERTGRNPQTGETITIPKRRVVHFRPGTKLRADVNHR